MPTWPEARAAKLNRQDREALEKRRRHNVRPGPLCPRCGLVTSLALIERGGPTTHPTCFTIDDDPA